MRGRIAADGSEIEALDEEDVVAAARELQARGVEIAVVAFLHSYQNPAHERAARATIERSGIGLRLELSSEVWPQAREYERGVLTAINASIRQIVEAYVDRLDAGLSERSIATPARVARSNGGAELARSMRRRPVVALLSGPAAGVAGAALAAQDAGWEAADLMALDVGGTSADIGVIRGGRPVLWLAEQTASLTVRDTRVEIAADMRYDGQGYDVTVSLAAHWLLEGDFPRLRNAFHAAHRATYGHANEAAEIWLKELRAHVTGATPKPHITPVRSASGGAAPAARVFRMFGREFLATVYQRAGLRAGQRVSGPAIVTQMDTTSLIPEG